MLFAGHSKRLVCPVCCHQSLIYRYDPAAHAYSTSPLFALYDGAALTRHGFLSFTSSRLRTGQCLAHYSRHSFRIGGATSAANAAIPDHLVKTIGRWSSDCYQCYIISISQTRTHRKVCQSVLLTLIVWANLPLGSI